MYFLCSNFRQINNNVVTVKNNVARTTTVSDMQTFFNYWSRYERGYNSPELLADDIINPSNQVVNKYSYETSHLHNMTNEMPAQDGDGANKNKEHKISVPNHSNWKKIFFFHKT